MTEMPGGTFVAANAGDYIYPSDIRFESADDHLFVRADGAAAGVWLQTWLFEYDISAQRLLGKVQVDPMKLPPQCPAPY